LSAPRSCAIVCRRKTCARCTGSSNGQILFFEANHWNPQVFVKTSSRHWQMVRPSLLPGAHAEQIDEDGVGAGLHQHRDHSVRYRTSARSGVDAAPLQSLSYIMEHAPVLREVCGTLYIWARKPGGASLRPPVDLADHPELAGVVSVVVPCHNEEMNVPNLVRQLIGFYGWYIHEIIIVNDNSKDRTAGVTREAGPLGSGQNHSRSAPTRRSLTPTEFCTTTRKAVK
jgi:hypothetical protein